MSSWTYINGTITIRNLLGRTQAEIRYILDTILDHLPVVSGSERDMEVYVIQKRRYNSSCSCDEFGYRTNNLIDDYGRKNRKHGSLRTQDEYILVVNGSLRDTYLSDTVKQFNKWLCRLAKRISVEDVLVEVKGYDESVIIRNTNDTYSEMWESPSWWRNGVGNWCEYLIRIGGDEE